MVAQDRAVGMTVAPATATIIAAPEVLLTAVPVAGAVPAGRLTVVPAIGGVPVAGVAPAAVPAIGAAPVVVPVGLLTAVPAIGAAPVVVPADLLTAASAIGVAPAAVLAGLRMAVRSMVAPVAAPVLRAGHDMISPTQTGGAMPLPGLRSPEVPPRKSLA
jgi:hypothetical protein